MCRVRVRVGGFKAGLKVVVLVFTILHRTLLPLEQSTWMQFYHPECALAFLVVLKLQR